METESGEQTLRLQVDTFETAGFDGGAGDGRCAGINIYHTFRFKDLRNMLTLGLLRNLGNITSKTLFNRGYAGYGRRLYI
jgi:hypothetical protein